MQSQYMQFEFGNLHYREFQSGKATTLLLLHAFHSSLEAYQPLCELLKDQYNLVCLDFPGHGLSSHVDVDQYAWYYSMEGFTAVLGEFIQRLGLENYYIVGNSVGGNSTIRGLDQLTGLQGVMLIGSAQASSVEMIFSFHHQSRALELLFQKHRTQEEDQIVAAAYVDPTARQGAAYQQMLQDIQRTDPNCRALFAEQMNTQEWVDELQRVATAPISLTYLLGEDDGFIDAHSYQHILTDAGFPASQIHLLKGVRHVPMLEDPSTVADKIIGVTHTAE